MAAQFYKINYKSDFVLTINSDAGWAVPFCIKFWTGMPSQAYFVGFDGENYVNCRVGETPTQLLVMFDDHHMPIGELKMQIAYHTTIEEFPDRQFDEVTNPTNVTVDIDGTEYQVMLDFTGESGAEIDFSMPSSGVMSVNGKIGHVTLNAEDVGAQPTIEDLATIRSGAAAGATAYQKPGTGIPKTDLASGVQSSLDKADAAAPQANTYTKGEVNVLVEEVVSHQTMIVTISSDGNYTADKTFAEIKSFIDNGGTVIAKDEQDGESYYYLDNYIASEVVFHRNIWGSNGFTTRSYTIDNTNTVTFDDSLHFISSDVNSSSTANLANSAAVKTVNDKVATKQDTISDLATIRSGAAAGATAVQPAELQEGLAEKQDAIEDLATIRSGAAAGATAVQPAGLTPIESALQTIESVIPSAATAQNQLADKNFVNSSIATNTANFVGTYNSLAELQVVQNPTNNDYGFVIETDAEGNEYYDRYKYVASSQQWLFEYKVESTPFTATQWAAIQSGITSALVTKLNALPTNAELQQTLDGKADAADIPTALSQLSQDSTHRTVTDSEKSTWNGKQNAISDLATIRSGAAAGATAVQPAALQEGLAGKQDTINTVNVTVDNNTGTPSGSASVSGSTLSLSFQNLKGTTGATGATGPQGPQGERGLPGESGVTGDVSGFTVIQTIDPSATYGATDIAGAATVQATNQELTELAGTVDEEVDSINNRISEIVGGEKSVLDYYDVAQGGRITFTPITLSEDGDELYIEALPISTCNSMANGGYGFTFSQSNANKIVIGLCYVYMCVRSDDNTWIWGPNGSIGDSTSYNRKYIRIKFVNGNIEVYGNDGLKTTYTAGQKTITIDGIGGSQNTLSQRWGGKIWHFQYTHAGVTKELEELDGFAIDENVEVVTKSIVIEGELTTIEERLDDIEERLDNVDERIDNIEEVTGDLAELQVYVDEIKELGWGVQIKGNSNSILTCKTPIVLSQDGDSIEISFGAINSESFTSGGYAFTRRDLSGSYTGVDGLFVSESYFAARSDDKTWLITVADYMPMGNRIKVLYENGNMLFYIDNVLKKTYTGQKTITINSFADGANHEYGYWSGIINGISVNGTPLSLTSDFVWGSDVELYRADGFLNVEQSEKLALLLPENVVEASENEVSIYTKIDGKKYAGFTIVHTISQTDADYTDYWRIHNGRFYQFDGANFVIGGNLLINAENEFAIRFADTSDFSGGYHGDERIDLDANCYIVFIVDGKEYSISELVALGRVACGTFSYREKSVMYSEYSTTSAHNRWATHVKTTEFKDGGFVTRNFVQMETSLTINTAYVGLVCVNKNCADYVTGDDGTIYTATHPSTQTVLVQSLNMASNVAKFWKGNASCTVDSHVVGTNISNWQTLPVHIVIWDRVGDLKYYNMLPQNVAVTASSFFMFECSAKFEKRDN